MTERKPRDMSVGSWIDQQIAEAARRGAFDDLPGAGKPIPRRSGGTEAWLQDYLRREGVSADELLPTPLRLRKEAERLDELLGGVQEDLLAPLSPSERDQLARLLSRVLDHHSGL